MAIYDNFQEQDNSFFAIKIREFKEAFNSMVNKFEKSSINFQGLHLQKNQSNMNVIQDFIHYPDEDNIDIPQDKWEIRNEQNYQNIENEINEINEEKKKI